MGERVHSVEVPLRVQNRIIRAVRAQILATDPVLRAAGAMLRARRVAEPVLEQGEGAVCRRALNTVRAALRKAGGRAR